MTGKTTAAPMRIGVLGAARIADLAIVRPARVTGHRLVAVAARDRRRTMPSLPGPAGRPGSRPPAPANVPGTRESMNGSTPTWNSPAAPPDGPAATWPPGQRRYHCRIIGSRGEATALNFVEPHHDDRIIVTTAAGTRTEELGRRSSYTYQLEAFAAHLRNGAPLPTGADDAVANMQLIDDCYRAAGLPPRPAGQPLINEAAH